MLTHDNRIHIETVWIKIEASTCEDEKDHWRSQLKQSHPGVTCGGLEQNWDKRDLVDLYEDIAFGGSLEGTKMVPDELTTEFKDFKELPESLIQTRKSYFCHASHNGQDVTASEEVKLEEILYWRAVAPKVQRDRKRQKKSKEHFEECNWYMPLLLGSQHSNRFKRNSKVYVLFGEHKGRHGVVIGHRIGFNIKEWGSPTGKSPLLKLLMVNRETGYLEVRDVFQDVVKLVDLHDFLPFAVPMLAPSEEPDKSAMLKIKCECNPHLSVATASKRFWGVERDQYWSYESGVVTRRNAGI